MQMLFRVFDLIICVSRKFLSLKNIPTVVFFFDELILSIQHAFLIKSYYTTRVIGEILASTIKFFLRVMIV